MVADIGLNEAHTFWQAARGLPEGIVLKALEHIRWQDRPALFLRDPRSNLMQARGAGLGVKLLLRVEN